MNNICVGDTNVRKSASYCFCLSNALGGSSDRPFVSITLGRNLLILDMCRNSGKDRKIEVCMCALW